jgi:hypothetical protein
VSAEENPLFTVVKGEPSAEELAALTAVVLGAASGGAEPERAPASRAAGARPRRLARVRPAPLTSTLS